MVAVPEQFRKVTGCDSKEKQVGFHSKKIGNKQVKFYCSLSYLNKTLSPSQIFFFNSTVHYFVFFLYCATECNFHPQCISNVIFSDIIVYLINSALSSVLKNCVKIIKILKWKTTNGLSRSFSAENEISLAPHNHFDQINLLYFIFSQYYYCNLEFY